MRPDDVILSSKYFPNLDELLLIPVWELPKASISWFTRKIRSSKFLLTACAENMPKILLLLVRYKNLQPNNSKIILLFLDGPTVWEVN